MVWAYKGLRRCLALALQRRPGGFRCHGAFRGSSGRLDPRRRRGRRLAPASLPGARQGGDRGLWHLGGLLELRSDGRFLWRLDFKPPFKAFRS